MRVEHRICSTICGTLVQAIWDHENLTELAGGVREGQNLPQNGLNLASLHTGLVCTSFGSFGGTVYIVTSPGTVLVLLILI